MELNRIAFSNLYYKIITKIIQSLTLKYVIANS